MSPKLEPKWDEPSIISSGIDRVGNEIKRLDDLRISNRNIALLAVGASIGFSVKEQSLLSVLAICLGGIIVTIMFWLQDHNLHKYKHGWQGVNKRLFKYLRGQIDKEEYVFLKYSENDEKFAHFFSITTIYTYVILMIALISVFFYRFASIKYLAGKP